MRIAILLACTACSGGLSKIDQDNLRNAWASSDRSYTYQDAGDPGAALIRGTHCSVNAVLRNNHIPPPGDSGIQCP